MKWKRILYIIIFLILSSLIIENNKEVDNMAKYEQFASISSTNDDLEDLQNYHNIGKYGTDYWYADVDGDDFCVYSVDGLTGATTKEDSYALGLSGKVVENYMCKVLYTDSDWVICAVIAYVDAGNLKISSIFKNITDAGAFIQDTDGGGGAIGTTGAIMDIITIDQSNAYIEVIANYGPFLGDQYIGLWTVDTDGANEGILDFEVDLDSTSGLDAVDAMWTGCVSDVNTYKFVFKNAAGNYILLTAIQTMKAAYTTSNPETLSGIAAPTTWNLDVQQYWIEDGVEWMMDEDHFYIRTAGSDWGSFSDVGTTTNAIIWDYNSDNQYKPQYVVWKDSIFKIVKGAPYKIQEFADDAYVGWTDWFSNGADTLYQMSLSTYECSKCFITNKIMDTQDFDIITLSEPFENQTLVLYDENDVLRGIPFVKKHRKDKDTAEFKLECISIFERDLDTKVSYTPSAKDAPDIMKYIIDTYCGTINYGAATINTTPATTYSLPFKKSVKEVFKWAAMQEGYIWSLRPDGTIYYDQMTASGDTLTFGTDNMGVPVVFDETLKLSYIEITGAIVDNVRLTSSKHGEPNNGRYFDRYPEIDNQTNLDSMRDNILSQKNVAYTVYSDYTNGVMYFYAGTTVTLTDSNYSISGDTYYINGSIWDLVPGNKSCSINSTSALIVPDIRNKITGNKKIDSAISAVSKQSEKNYQDLSQDIENTVPTTGGTFTGDVTINAKMIVDTDTGNDPHYITRTGGLTQAFKTYIEDWAMYQIYIQDEGAGNHTWIRDIDTDADGIHLWKIKGTEKMKLDTDSLVCQTNILARDGHIIYVWSAGNDKYGYFQHDDTNAILGVSSGDLSFEISGNEKMKLDTDNFDAQTHIRARAAHLLYAYDSGNVDYIEIGSNGSEENIWTSNELYIWKPTNCRAGPAGAWQTLDCGTFTEHSIPLPDDLPDWKEKLPDFLKTETITRATEEYEVEEDEEIDVYNTETKKLEKVTVRVKKKKHRKVGPEIRSIGINVGMTARLALRENAELKTRVENLEKEINAILTKLERG